MMQPRSQSQHRRGRPPRPPPPPSSSPSPSPSPPSSPRRRRALRPRLTPRPLFEDFYGLTSSDEEKTEIERKGRKKLKLVTKIQSNNSNSNSKISEKKRRPMGRRHVAGSDLSNSSYVEDEGESEDEVKPLKKRRIGSSGEKLGFEGSSHHHEVRRNNAGPRTKGSVSGLSPKLMRTTPLPDRKALEEILDKLQKKDAYGVFAEPVNADELPDYYDVIEHPMDFGTVRRKLARNVYRSFEQFEDDVFLICSNAMQYNAPDTIYFRQAHSIQELARSKFQKLREEGLKDPEPDSNPKPVKLFKPVEKKQIKREQFETMHENNKQHSFSNNKNDYNKKNREEKMKKIKKIKKREKEKEKEREKEKEKEKEKVKLVNKVHKIHKNSEIKFRDNKSPINSHKHVKKQSFNSNRSTNKKKPFVRVCQEPMSSDISSTGDAGTTGTAGTVLSASRNNDNCNNEIDYDSNRNKYEKIHWLMDDTSCSFDDNLSGRESPVMPVKKYMYFNSDDEDGLAVDMDRRESYTEKELYIKSDPIFDCVPPSPNHLLPVGLEIECTYTRSLARFAAYVGPTAWKIVSNKIQRSLPAGTQFGRGWVGEPEPLSPPFLSLGPSHPIPNPNSKSKSTQPVRNNNSSSGNSTSQGLTIGVDQLPRVNNSKGRHERAGPTNAANHHVRKNHSKETVNNNNNTNNNSSPNVFLKPPEVTTPRNANSPNNTNNPFRVSGNAKVSTSNNQGQNRKSAPMTNPMGGFITKQPPPPVNSNTHHQHHQHHHNNNNNGPRLNGLPGQPVTTNRPGTGGTSTSQKGFFMPVQTVKKEAESPKNSTQPPQSWISFGGASYETKPSINVPPPVQVPVPAFLGTQVRPTSISNNAPVWRPVTNSNNPSVSTTTSSSSVNTPTTQYMHVQGQGQGQNGNLMIFPQLVQRDAARFQGQVPSWQGFVPVNQPRQARETQTLRPDLNIGFNSPVSSPHGQSSGINLEAQQPDLALQL